MCKTGIWLDATDYNPTADGYDPPIIYAYRCSVCSAWFERYEVEEKYYNRCPYCKTKMIEKEDFC